MRHDPDDPEEDEDEGDTPIITHEAEYSTEDEK